MSESLYDDASCRAFIQIGLEEWRNNQYPKVGEDLRRVYIQRGVAFIAGNNVPVGVEYLAEKLNLAINTIVSLQKEAKEAK